MRSLRIEIINVNMREQLTLDRLHAEPEDRNVLHVKVDNRYIIDRLHAEPEDRNSYHGVTTNNLIRQAPCGA